MPLTYTIRLVRRLFAFIALAAGLSFAHAILVDSTPAVHGTVSGDAIDVALHFNSRIDGKRSQLTLISAKGSQREPIDDQKEPDRITAHVSGLSPGSYRLIWQVLAADGHLTRGQIPFTVK